MTPKTAQENRDRAVQALTALSPAQAELSHYLHDLVWLVENNPERKAAFMDLEELSRAHATANLLASYFTTLAEETERTYDHRAESMVGA